MAANQTTMAELAQKAKLPARQAGGSTVQEFFTANKSAIESVLPKHMTPDRMMKIAMGAFRTTPALMECTTESLFGAVIQCAQLGLEPNTPMGHAYMIPFNKNVNGQWRKDVNVVIGYRGLIDLARRSGQIVSISAHEVCANDEFDFGYGLEDKLVHKPGMENRGRVVCFYAVAHLVGGGHAYEVMSAEQVNEIRDAAALKNGAKPDPKTGDIAIKGPWKDHYIEMGRKTALRRLFKYLPISIELATAVELDGRSESGKPQNMEDVLKGEVIATSYEDDEDEIKEETEHRSEQEVTKPAAKPAKQSAEQKSVPTAEPVPESDGKALAEALESVAEGDYEAATIIAKTLQYAEQQQIYKAIGASKAKYPAHDDGTEMNLE